MRRFFTLQAAFTALLVTFLWSLTNLPWLKNPAKFWNSIALDQSMFVGFMLKKYGHAAYPHDFVFTTDPKVATLYNPTDLFIVHSLYSLLGANIPLVFFTISLVSTFLYVTIMYGSLLVFTSSHKAAFLISSLSTVSVSFTGDSWGMGTLIHARGAFYILPFLILCVYLSIKTLYSTKILPILAASFIIGLVTLVHPVTGYHAFTSLVGVSFFMEFIRKKRWFINSIIRGVGFSLGAFPLFISFAQNALFDVSAQKPNVFSQDIVEALKVVNPSYFGHVMPDVLTTLSNSVLTMPIFIISLTLFVITQFYVLWHIVKKYLQNNWTRWEKYRLWKYSYVATIPLFALTVSGFRQFLPGPFVNVLIVLTVLIILILNGIRVKQAKNITTYDAFLLLIINISLATSLLGSWIVNATLSMLDSTVRVFEQIRGIRIAYLAYILYFALTAAWVFKSVKNIYHKALIVMPMLLLFTFSYLHFLKINYAPPSTRENELYELCQWAKKFTPSESLFTMLTSNYMVEGIRFKSCSRRSMTYSYDAINFNYTNTVALLAAQKRMESINKILTSQNVDVLDIFTQSYLVLDQNTSFPKTLNPVYSNSTFIVLPPTL